MINTKTINGFDALLIVACMVMVPSAVIQSYFGTDPKGMFAILCPIILVIGFAANRIRITKKLIILILPIWVIGALATMLSGSNSQLLMAFTLTLAVMAGQLLCISLYNPVLLRIICFFTLFLLIGGLVGIIYSFAGGQPILEMPLGYRTTSLYLTTFSFATIGNIIRPSGIFDEPGAFAMYVGIVTMFNDILLKNSRMNYVLVILMALTGSLAGLLLVVLYLVFSNLTRELRGRNLKIISAFVLVVLTVQFLYPTNPITVAIDTFYSDRLEVVDGRLAGDNRSQQVDEFFKLVDEEMLIRGVKSSSKIYIEEDQSSNPFSITFGYGLLISLPYFGLLLWLVIMTFRGGGRNIYASLGLLVLLLQRPYLYNMSWSILIATTVWLLYYSQRRCLPRGVSPERRRLGKLER